MSNKNWNVRKLQIITTFSSFLKVNLHKLHCFLLLSNLLCFLQLKKTLHECFSSNLVKLDLDLDPDPDPHSEKLLDKDPDPHKMKADRQPCPTPIHFVMHSYNQGLLFCFLQWINTDRSFQVQLPREQELVRLATGQSQVARRAKKDLELIQACRNFNRTTIEQFISTVLTLIDFGKKSGTKKKSVAKPKKEIYFFSSQIFNIFILIYLQNLNLNTHCVEFFHTNVCVKCKKRWATILDGCLFER